MIVFEIISERTNDDGKMTQMSQSVTAEQFSDVTAALETMFEGLDDEVIAVIKRHDICQQIEPKCTAS